MINNTVGVQKGKLHNSSVEFFWKKNKQGKPASFFVPPDGKGWFWPKACILINNKLYIFLSQIDKTKEDPGAMDFKTIGGWIGLVNNPFETPTKWTYQIEKTPFLTFDSAVLIKDNYLYVYGFYDKHTTMMGKNLTDRQMVMARVNVNQTKDYKSWKFYNKNQWKSGVENASAIFSGVGTEYSVNYLPKINQYLLVTNAPFLSPVIIARTSPNQWGPWSDAIQLYSSEEVKQKNVFCYAGKHHPIFNENNSFVISYACNSFNIYDVINNSSLYVPKFVKVVYSSE